MALNAASVPLSSTCSTSGPGVAALAPHARPNAQRQALQMSQTSVLRPATRPLAPTRLLAVALGEAAQRGPADQQAARNLVIAVDASDDSVAAFRWTLTNLYRPGDSLHLLHVVPDAASQPAASGSLFYPPNDPLDEADALTHQAEEFIAAEFVALAARRGVEVNVILLKDSRHKHVGRAVCRKAEELGAAPLVLATHHKSYWAEMLLGSVSKFCAANCKQPVLLVHPDHSQVQW